MVTALIVLLLASAGLGAGFLIKRDLPESVSELAYLLPHPMFPLWLFVTGAVMATGLFDALGDKSWMAFIFVLTILGVAATAWYKKENKRLHDICGCLACGVGVACGLAVSPWTALVWLPCVAAVKFDSERWVLWAELATFLQLVVALIVG